VNNDLAMVTRLVACGADVNQRACGRFFLPEDQKLQRNGDTDYRGLSHHVILIRLFVSLDTRKQDDRQTAIQYIQSSTAVFNIHRVREKGATLFWNITLDFWVDLYIHCGAKKLHRFIFAISLSNQAIF